ncbi:SAM-dependent methyltransferase [Ramlibacter alkalitolerans]|uniref:SAM-dependent methyltransferase n=1 Tax=Ramlibacter alkalitolerans TaxID=2039631 RepID=A0ABS1JRA7_9BURK|nr:SAM-dependent methyltransferase [Ramlibacter alkalitolerans]MBL0426105.1 SAM-dependent methyltransferase [Ramlibacter alkalitolerans]
MPGRLYLVPAPLDFGCEQTVALGEVLPAGTLAVAARLSHWICENAKSARAYLKRVGEVQPLALPLQQQRITELPRQVHKKGDHKPSSFDARPLLQAAAAGEDMGLLSEAGMPAVADPGSSVVRAAHELGIEVVPLVGPVSLLLTLAASGLNGQDFAFVGYLPQDAPARAQRLRELEALAWRTGQTQLFIETPYRNEAVWQALLQTLKPQTRLAVGTGLTLPEASCRSASAAAWKQRPSPVRNDTPAVFAIGP